MRRYGRVVFVQYWMTGGRALGHLALRHLGKSWLVVGGLSHGAMFLDERISTVCGIGP